MQSPIALWFAFVLSLACATAGADVPSFRIAQIYSNIDGSRQFVELIETEGRNGQHHFAGLKLTATYDGVVKEFTFDGDLPTDQTAHRSIVVAVSSILPVEGGGFLYYCCYQPTYWGLPPRFLPTERGTIDFAGVDRVTYVALPSDGGTAIARDGSPIAATVPTGSVCSQGVGCVTLRVSLSTQWHHIRAVEFYNAKLDHYFTTASAADFEAIESGRVTGWQRTGESFEVSGGPGAYPGMDRNVCRFRLPPEAGDSHFLSASADECKAVADLIPQAVLETRTAFHVAMPDPVTGTCPPDLDWNNGPGPLAPVYRVWNRRADTNHRYTSDRTTRDRMVGQGWIAEGYGPEAVAFCAR